MKLVELEPRWIVFGPNSDGATWIRGIAYNCPKTGRRHAVEFRPVIGPSPVRSDSMQAMNEQPVWPGQPIWVRASGDSFDTLTISPSIDRPCCHDAFDAAIADSAIKAAIAQVDAARTEGKGNG